MVQAWGDLHIMPFPSSTLRFISVVAQKHTIVLSFYFAHTTVREGVRADSLAGGQAPAPCVARWQTALGCTAASTAGVRPAARRDGLTTADIAATLDRYAAVRAGPLITFYLRVRRGSFSSGGAFSGLLRHCYLCCVPFARTAAARCRRYHCTTLPPGGTPKRPSFRFATRTKLHFCTTRLPIHFERACGRPLPA